MNTARDLVSGRGAAARPWFAALCLLAFTSLVQAVPVTVFTVGDTGCDYLDLRSALSAAAMEVGSGEIPPQVEIHLAVSEDDSLGYSWNGSNSEVVVADPSADIDIIGGYSSCDAATPSAGAYTDLVYANVDLDAPHSMLRYSNAVSNARRSLGLANIRMLGATDASKGGPDYGGGIRIGGNANVSLWHSRVAGFHAAMGGGGVALFGSGIDPSSYPRLDLVNDSVVILNSADNGGGVYSWFGRVRLAGAQVSSNSASSNGAGLYLFDHEDAGDILDDSHFALLMDSFTSPNYIGGNVAGSGIYSSTSGLGGGVYSLYGQIRAKGFPGSDGGYQNYVISNEANAGGGIYMQGPNQDAGGPYTGLRLADTNFWRNVSNGHGGALYLLNAVDAFMYSTGGECTYGSSAPFRGPCMYFGDNQAKGIDGAGETARGGAIYLTNTRSDGISRAIVRVSRAWFDGNADPNGLAAVAAAGGASELVFNRDIFTNNIASNSASAASALIFSHTGKDVDFRQNTVLENNTSTRMFNIGGGNLDVTGSILWGTVDRTHPFHFVWFSTGGATLTHNGCLLIRASDDGTVGIPAPEMLWAGHAPDLDGRFAPRGGSAAIDHCEPPTGELALGAYLNLAANVPGVESRYGIQDLGAVEQTDIIFANMFGGRPGN